MRKRYLLLVPFVAVVLYAAFFLSENKENYSPKKLTGISSEKLLQQRIDKKLERRKNGYSKSDQPDKYVLYKNSLISGFGKSSYPENHKLIELKSALAHRSSLKMTSEDISWEQRGPGNVGGRTRAIIVDPSDDSNNTWYAGAIAGGVWKTTDSGSTWEIISPDIPNLSISSLAVSSSNTNVIYAGSGEGYYNIDAVRGDGIYKSSDKGETWEALANTSDNSTFFYVNSLVVAQDDENTVWAATNKAVMKSTDGGENWSEVTPAEGGERRYQKILIHPTNDDVLWTAANSNAIYKSDNGGEDWFEVYSLSGVGRIEITVSKENSNVLYAMDSNSKLYYSQDGGMEWAETEESGDATEFLSSQGWYNNTLAVNPDDTDKGFAGGVDFYNFELGTDVSGTERLAYNIVNGLSDYIEFDYFEGSHVNGGLKFYAAYDEVKDIEIQFGDGSQKAHRLIYDTSTSALQMNIDDDIDNFSYQDYVDVPFKVVRTDGTTSEQLMVSFVDYNDDDIFNLYDDSYELIIIHDLVYDEAQANVDISTNGGNSDLLLALYPQLPTDATWDEASLPAENITVDAYYLSNKSLTATKLTDWAADESDSDYSHADHHNITIIPETGDPFAIIVGNDGGLGYSEDGGVTWTRKSDGYITSQFYGIARHPSEYKYFGGMQDNGSYISASDPSKLDSWTALLGGDGFDVAWHSRDPDKILGSIYYNYVLTSYDQGSTWYDRSTDIGDNSSDDAPFITKVASSPVDPDLLFVGGESGLWRSDDFGESWTNIYMGTNWGYGSSGTPNIAISNANPSIVWAGVVMSSSSQSGTLHLSTDGGNSFSDVSIAIDAETVSIGAITNIIAHPTDENTAYVLFSYSGWPKIYRTTDLGDTWEDITQFGDDGESLNGFPDVATNTLLVMPFDTDEIWVGTEIGLFISYDNGATWAYADNGIPAVSIWDMKVAGDEVIVGTHGLGVWTVMRDGLTNDMENPYISNIGVNPDGEIVFETEFDVDLDQIEIYTDNVVYSTVDDIAAGTRLDALDGELIDGYSLLRVVGYKDGISYSSNSKEIPDLEVLEAQDSYTNTFSSGASDFYGSGFEVSSTSLDNNALTTPHPYSTQEDFTYTLKYPIVVSADENVSFLKYKDIAYIETGESYASYPDEYFYDYVVVEGTKDGLNWEALASGYDFSYSSLWYDSGDTYADTPSSSQYVYHIVKLEDTFEPGDVIMIRFVLHSDPAAVGWGWAIDNLQIQEEISGVFNNSVADFKLILFPNPTESDFVIKVEDVYLGEVQVSVCTMAGKVVYSSSFVKDGENFQQEINANIDIKGNYIVQVKLGGKQSAQILSVR